MWLRTVLDDGKRSALKYFTLVSPALRLPRHVGSCPGPSGGGGGVGGGIKGRLREGTQGPNNTGAQGCNAVGGGGTWGGV